MHRVQVEHFFKMEMRKIGLQRLGTAVRSCFQGSRPHSGYGYISIFIVGNDLSLFLIPPIITWCNMPGEPNPGPLGRTIPGGSCHRKLTLLCCHCKFMISGTFRFCVLRFEAVLPFSYITGSFFQIFQRSRVLFIPTIRHHHDESYAARQSFTEGVPFQGMEVFFPCRAGDVFRE